MNGSEVSTRSLVLVPFAPEWLRALIESADRFEDASGLRAAPGLRDFFVSGEVSSGFVEALASASGPDPWGWGFAAILRDAGVVIGSGGFKGPPDEDGAVEIAYAIVPDQQGRVLQRDRLALVATLDDDDLGRYAAAGLGGLRLALRTTLRSALPAARALPGDAGAEHVGADHRDAGQHEDPQDREVGEPDQDQGQLGQDALTLV